ncbi:MAG TPA: hypothetical protein VEG42_04615 [Thermoplasmata archaeon]|nr:hypothetical protein [Thermoplasmata archaeon]
MPRRKDPLSRAQHRKIGADLFNYTWTLLDRKSRSSDQDNEMLNAAHASRYHWSHAGKALQESIGEWQLSRVYSVLGRAEPALYHGRRCLEVSREACLASFYRAYAYEAMARASGVAGKRADRNRYLREARKVGEGVRERHARRMLFEDLETIP